MRAVIILNTSLVLCLCGLAYGWTDCGSEVGVIVSVDISGCGQTNKRCILKRDTNVTMELSFTSNADSNSLTAVVHGVILSMPVPFDLPNPDGCKDSDISCPIKAGQTYKYITTMPIRSTYPRVTVDIKWELQDQDGKDIICALIPAKIG